MAKSSESDALLRAVCAAPDDDAPRLVYADWLEEHGDAPDRDRAELIRTQIELARIDEANEQFEALKEREGDLLREHRDAWEDEVLAGFTAFALRDMWGVSTWRRGFLARVYVLNTDPFIAQADSFFERVPAGEVLLHWTYDPDPEREGDAFGRLLASPQVGWITGLKTVGRGYGLDGLEFWFHSAHAPNLEQLDTHDCDYYGWHIAAAIAKAPGLTGLRWMDLSGNQIEDEGLRILAGAAHLSGLKTLLLGIDMGDSTNDLTGAGLAALAASPHLAGLECLDVDGNEDIGDAGAEALARSPHLTSLRDLNLSYCGVGDEGVLALASSPHLAGLKRLHLSGSTLTDAAAEALARSPYLSNLVRLNLEGCDDQAAYGFISLAGTRLLRQRFGRRVEGLLDE